MTEEAKHTGSIKLYVIFSVVLSVITFFEWLIFKERVSWGLTSAVLITSLLILSIIKFVMVVGWYMHLRYDPSMLKKIFVAALVIMTGIGLSLGVLMS